MENNSLKYSALGISNHNWQVLLKSVHKNVKDDDIVRYVGLNEGGAYVCVHSYLQILF
jgi:hypothetical protein